MVVKASRKSTFGNVRQLPSGRYQVRYTGSDGLQHTAPRTYGTKADANAYLATVQSDLVRETWKAPRHARITLGEFGRTWIDQRPIKASTRERYRSAWNLHIDPRIGVTRSATSPPRSCASGTPNSASTCGRPWPSEAGGLRRSTRPDRRPWPTRTGFSRRS